jgi:hypothetical protein
MRCFGWLSFVEEPLHLFKLSCDKYFKCIGDGSCMRCFEWFPVVEEPLRLFKFSCNKCFQMDVYISLYWILICFYADYQNHDLFVVRIECAPYPRTSSARLRGVQSAPISDFPLFNNIEILKYWNNSIILKYIEILLYFNNIVFIGILKCYLNTILLKYFEILLYFNNIVIYWNIALISIILKYIEKHIFQ